MQGQVLVYNPEKQTGAIAATNGQRFIFSIRDWSDAASPERGMMVDFQIDEDNRPYQVRLTSASAPVPAPAVAQTRQTTSLRRPQTPASQVMPPRQHSGLGIASFIVSLVTGVGMLALIGIAAAAAEAEDGFAESPLANVLGLLLLLAMFVQVVALGLGIGGLAQSKRRKVFALTGFRGPAEPDADRAAAHMSLHRFVLWQGRALKLRADTNLNKLEVCLTSEEG